MRAVTPLTLRHHDRLTRAGKPAARCQAHATHARRAHVACAPHAAENKVGSNGAKELGAALKDNMTLTTLDIRSACSSSSHPALPCAHMQMNMDMGDAALPSVHRTRLPRPQRILPVCCRQ